MLRITIEEKDNFIRFRLEGKLIGEWVKELGRAWICAKNANHGARFKIDLRGVTFVDEKGKALLETMASEGAELVADTPMMTSLVHSIVEHLKMEHANR